MEKLQVTVRDPAVNFLWERYGAAPDGRKGRKAGSLPSVSGQMQQALQMQGEAGNRTQDYRPGRWKAEKSGSDLNSNSEKKERSTGADGPCASFFLWEDKCFQKSVWIWIIIVVGQANDIVRCF